MYKIDENALLVRFNEDISKISTDLILGFNLKYKQETPNLASSLLRWLDFRQRYVEPKMRQIALSDKFPKRNLPIHIERAFDALIDRFQQGDDVNPYQSESLIFKHDTSSKKRQNRTDLLWADWKISHFHLTLNPIKPSKYFSDRSSHQAFCIVESNFVLVIDVLPHPKEEGWANPDLLETLVRNWPAYMERWQIKGRIGGVPKTATEIQTLRQSGLGSFENINGKLYMGPGGGITSASTATKTTFDENFIRRHIANLVKDVCHPNSQYQEKMLEFGISDPSFSLKITPLGLAIYEENSSVAFTLPRPKPDSNPPAFAILHDLMLPKWALNIIVRSSESR